MKIITLFVLLFLVSCQVKKAQETGVVEGHVPSVAKFTLTTPLNTSYAPASVIPLTLTFPKVVTVTGTPRLTLTIGATSRTADYVSGSGSAVLVFNYTVQAGENDTNGIAVSTTLDLNGGTLIYETDKNCSTTITVPSLATVLVDSTAPTITLTTPPSNGTYIAGGVLNFSFQFSEVVTVTGTPRLPITLTSGTVYADYLSGSGTNTLLFRYTVLAADEDADGLAMGALDLNGGTIIDAVAYNATLTYTPPDTSAVLIAGNTPTITSITPPTNGRYLTTQDVDFTVNFDQTVIVTLTPRIAITLGSGTVYATYISGGGTSSLIFRYTVGAGDYDTNGITLVSPLEPNGGAIQNVTMTTNALLTYTAPNTASITIDGLDPVISSVSAPANAWYVLSNNLNFTVNYTYPVTVTGTPKLSINIGGSALEASYLSGSGTTALIFRYTVAAANLDTDGIGNSSPLVLNGGTINDIFGDSAGLTFTPPVTTGVLVDAVTPTITSVTAPANATYFNGQNVDFSVLFSENVTVTGVPSIPLTVGVTSKNAVYTSGSGTNTLIFRYTVGVGDLDANGIANASPIALNAGTLKDAAGNNVTPLTFTPPTTTGVLVDGTAASIISVTPPANATYKTGNNVDFVVNFTQAVDVTGSPRIELTVGGTTLYATYLSGTSTSALTFRYTVAASEKDLDGLVLTSPLQLNGGTIQDSVPSNAVLTFTAPNTSGILIDGIDLTISSVTPPSDTTYLYNQNLDFVVNYNYPAVVTGSPRIQLTVGAATLYATYSSGSGTTALTFRYTVGGSDLDADGITSVGPNLELNSGTINDEFTDSASLAFTAANYPNVKVDGTVPTISSVTGPSASTYTEAQNLDFVVTFSEAVNVTGTRISLTIGVATKYATYLSGTGTTTVTYRYTVGAGDDDGNGISSSSPLDLNSGTIADISGNALSPLTFTPPDTSAVNVNTSAPVITSVTAPSNATYTTGNNIDFIVNYSSAIDVTGSPQISINAGGTTVYATYNSGSGSTALTFRYTVGAGHSDVDGVALSSPIGLNGGTLKSPGLVDAERTFTAPNTTGILVDGIDIVISSVTPPADATYKIGDDLDFTVNYNYAATVTGTPRVQLTVGAATLYATYVSGSGTSGHLFRYTVAASDVDTDGITTVSPIDLNSGTIKDAHGDNATLTFTGTNYPNKKVDGIRPTITNMVASANATYNVGQDIDFTATYSEAVTISGSPRLTLTIGITTRYATYSSGSGSKTIVFKYTVQAGDEDTDGIAVASAVDLNGGAITDSPGNAQTALTFTAPTLTGVLVDGIVPTVTSITPPASTIYGNSANLDFTVNFSEAVTITGSPTLSLNIGGSSVTATYLSGSPSTAIVFRYTTVTNNEDTNGVDSVSPLALAGGTIKDAALNNATLSFTGGNYAGVLVDAVAPTISSVTLPADNTYQNGGARPTLTFTVNFSENVTVAAGTPQIHLTIGSTTRYATYASGSGTAALDFSYSVAAADLDLDGIAVINSNNIDLNGATIRDAALNNAAVAMGSLVTNKIFAVIPSMRNWYDLSDTTKITTSGSDITAINDKIGTYNFTGAVPYTATGFNGGSNAFATCATTDYFSGGTPQTTPTAMIAVFRAPSTASTSQFLMYHANATRPMVQFNSTASSGTVTYGVTGAKYTSAWSGNAATQTSMWAVNGYSLRGFSWSGTQNRTPDICRMDGEIAEFFFFTAQPTVSEMDAIEAFLNTRYGLSFP